ncbi:MAG: hypothetical protein ACJ76H_13695 [Bacteriovoracaceae bacterium]
MKTIFIIVILFSVNAFADVTLQDCLDDASLQGDNKTPQQPLPECVNLVQTDPAIVSVSSADNKWKAFGVGSMLYLEQKDEDGNLIDRSLLAGAQTELVSIRKIFIDTTYKKLFILQFKNSTYELMIHDLLFIGNVTPQKVMRTSSFANVTSVKMADTQNIEVVTDTATYNVNADGESRTELSTKKAVVLTPK